MAVVGLTQSFCITGCFLWWVSFSSAAAATTATNTTSSGGANNTVRQALWPDYARDSQLSTANTYGYFTNIPFTYYECITNSLQVRHNGYVTFATSYDSAVPPEPAEWPFSPKILAVYWAQWKLDDDRVQQNYYILYDSKRQDNVTHESSLIRYVKDVVGEPEFEPLAVLAVTWENIRPKGNYNDTATFQVLIATDSRVTYAVRDYQSAWESPELANQTYYSAAYSQGNGARPKITIPGSQTGPEVIRLGTKKPNKDPYNCFQKTQSAVARLNASLNSLPPCPCYQLQAARDQQFTVSTSSAACYQSRTPPQGGSLLQLCCYNQYGHLINYTTEARVPVSADPNDRSLQDAYEGCCADGSGLCEWFYYRIYQTKCTNYTPALNASDLPSFLNRDKEIVIKSVSGTVINGFTTYSTTPVTFNVSTVFNSSHGFSLYQIGFNWNVARGLNELRKMSYPQRLVFYVTDSNNISATYAPLFKLCLCEQAAQCDVNAFAISLSKDTFGMDTFFGLDKYESGNVNSMVCECKGNGTGRFCEQPINACDNCLIQNTSVCDSNPQDYCPPCPYGYERNGTQCRDLQSIPAGGKRDNNSNSIYSITSTHVFLFIIISFISSSIPWLQNSLTNHL